MTNLESKYATQTDFCQALQAEMDRLYLLAFLFTTNHARTEACLLRVVADLQNDTTVFKPFVRTWIRRRIVKDLLRKQVGAPASQRQGRDAWFAGSCVGEYIEFVTALSPLERFAFVLTVLEDYSVKECALLLECDQKVVHEARLRALQSLGSEQTATMRNSTYFRATA